MSLFLISSAASAAWTCFLEVSSSATLASFSFLAVIVFTYFFHTKEKIEISIKLLITTPKMEKGAYLDFDRSTWPTSKAFTYLKIFCIETAKDKQLFFRRVPNEAFLWSDKGVEDEEPISSITIIIWYLMLCSETAIMKEYKTYKQT